MSRKPVWPPKIHHRKMNSVAIKAALFGFLGWNHHAVTFSAEKNPTVRPHRTAIQSSGGSGRSSGWKAKLPVLYLRLWQHDRGRGVEIAIWSREELWVPDQGNSAYCSPNTRQVLFSGIHRAAGNDLPLPQSQICAILPLRRKRHYGLRKMATFIRRLPGRHGAAPDATTQARTARQQQWLFAVELLLGNPDGTNAQHSKQSNVEPQRRNSTRRGVERDHWVEIQHDYGSARLRMERCRSADLAADALEEAKGGIV